MGESPRPPSKDASRGEGIVGGKGGAEEEEWNWMSRKG